MALGTAGGKCDVHSLGTEGISPLRSADLDFVVFAAPIPGMKVGFVALQTEGWLVGRQQVVRHGPVGKVATSTIFHHRLVLENERPLDILMTFEAEIVEALGGLELRLLSVVHVVTARTIHLAFLDRVTGWKLKLRENLPMAALTSLHRLGWGMDRVTVGAANILDGMGRSGPLRQTFGPVTVHAGIVADARRTEPQDQLRISFFGML